MGRELDAACSGDNTTTKARSPCAFTAGAPGAGLNFFRGLRHYRANAAGAKRDVTRKKSMQRTARLSRRKFLARAGKTALGSALGTQAPWE